MADFLASRTHPVEVVFENGPGDETDLLPGPALRKDFRIDHRIHPEDDVSLFT